MGSSTVKQDQRPMAQTRAGGWSMSVLGSMELPSASYGSNSATPRGSSNVRLPPNLVPPFKVEFRS